MASERIAACPLGTNTGATASTADEQPKKKKRGGVWSSYYTAMIRAREQGWFSLHTGAI